MNIDEAQQKIEEVLKNYEKLNGLSNISVPGSEDELSRYLKMTRSELSDLSIEDCAEIAFFLSQYSFYLQYQINKENGTHKWAEKKLIELTCDKLDDYDKYMKYENKIALIAKENAVVHKILYIMSYSTQIIERLSHLSNKLETLSDKMKNIQIVKSIRAKYND